MPIAIALTVSLPKMLAPHIVTITNVHVNLLFELVWFCAAVYLVSVAGKISSEFLNTALNVTLLVAV